MTVLRLTVRRLIAVALLLPAVAVLAEPPWDVVLRDRDRVVEIDRSSVIQSDSGSKVAWGRIVLSPERAASEGYASVKALNRYDCYNRSFSTVKRVYLDARHVMVREDGGLDGPPVLVARNSVDERMWQEVCRPPSVGDLQKVARDVGNIVAAAGMDVPGQTQTVAPARGAETGAGGASEKNAGKVRKAKAAPATPAAATAAPAAMANSARSAMTAKPKEKEKGVAAAERALRMAEAARKAGGAREWAWSYEGETGPEHWGKLRPEWAVCAEGKRQSPIDLRNGVAVELEPPRFDYRETGFRIADTGRTLRVHVGPGMGVEIRGQRYELDYFEFHRPSLERVGGQASDMVVHFVHRDPAGNVAIVAVLLEGSESAHPLVQTLWNNLPLERGTEYMPAAATIHLASLLPSRFAHYLFMGSLETPPCTEGVLWVVLKEPVLLSADQVGVFARLYPRNGRPIQPANGRLILESR